MTQEKILMYAMEAVYERWVREKDRLRCSAGQRFLPVTQSLERMYQKEIDTLGKMLAEPLEWVENE
jgi:hypothetical protein